MDEALLSTTLVPSKHTPSTYLTLQPVRFTLPRASPTGRWALTPPFHPYFPPQQPLSGVAKERKRFFFCGTLCQSISKKKTNCLPIQKYGALSCPDFPHSNNKTSYCLKKDNKSIALAARQGDTKKSPSHAKLNQR